MIEPTVPDIVECEGPVTITARRNPASSFWEFSMEAPPHFFNGRERPVENLADAEHSLRTWRVAGSPPDVRAAMVRVLERIIAARGLFAPADGDAALPIRPGTYRHFKGGLYEVAGTSILTTGDAGTTMVRYRGTDAGKEYVRTLGDFLAPVIFYPPGSDEPVKQPRFVFVELKECDAGA